MRKYLVLSFAVYVCGTVAPVNGGTDWPNRACELQKAEAAGQKGIDARWVQLIDEATKQKAPPLDRACLLRAYSDSLFSRSKFVASSDALKSAYKIAEEGNLPILMSNIMIRTDRAEHFEHQQNPSVKRNSSYLTKAAQLHASAAEPQAENDWQVEYNRGMGQLLADQGKHEQAAGYFKKSLKYLQLSPDQAIYREVIESFAGSLIANQQDAEAIKLIVDAKLNAQDKRSLIFSCRTAFANLDTQKSSITKHVDDLLNAKKWNELDIYFAKLAAEKQVLPNGRTPIDVAIMHIGDDLPASGHAKRITALEDWNKRAPKSAYAKIALAKMYTVYAWAARGTGFADTVSQQGWYLMRQRLAIASKYLNSVPTNQRCTAWYQTAFTVALGQSWDRARLDGLIAECTKKFPGYQGLITRKLYWLQPKWYGKPGEAAAYIDAEAKKMRTDQGKILLARAVWLYPGNDHGLRWDAVCNSFDALLKAYPNSQSVRNEYAVQALLNQDFSKAIALYQTTPP